MVSRKYIIWWLTAVNTMELYFKLHMCLNTFRHWLFINYIVSIDLRLCKIVLI